jgi:hypothetical protein
MEDVGFNSVAIENSHSGEEKKSTTAKRTHSSGTRAVSLALSERQDH